MTGFEPAELNKRADVERPVQRSAITPAKLLTLFSPDEWEDFVEEWMQGFGDEYKRIERRGGAGDKGRDVIGYTGEERTSCEIDIYQCKHYDHPLRPSDIWIELGKLCVFTHRGNFRVPRRYRLVAPRGVGNSLADLFDDPELLRAKLIENWRKHCEPSITTTASIRLEGALKAYVSSFDFKIVDYIPVKDLLEQHRRTSHWFKRFKQEPPERPEPAAVPGEVQDHELRYVEQLLAAYSERAKSVMSRVAELSAHEELASHFERCRRDYFMADSLNRFYRDVFPGGAFERVKDQLHDGVVETAERTYADGLERVRATLEQAVNVPLAQADYTPFVEPGDRKGVCHHLANEDRLTWVRK